MPRSSVITAGIAVLALYLAVVGMAYVLQGRLLFVPSSQIVATPSDAGMPFDTIRVTTDDGHRLHGWWIPAPDPNGKTILFFHGNAGNISGRIPFARHLRDAGFHVVLFDYSGYGESTGSPSESALYADARAMWQWLTRSRGVDPGDILLYGRSLGGGPATWLAADRAEEAPPHALVLESAFTSVPDIAAHHYPFLPVRWLSRIQFDNQARLPRVDVPVLILHGRRDEIVPFLHGQALYEAAEEPKRFVETNETHNSRSAAADRKRLAALRDLLTASPFE
jgi:hypothetical protein